MTVPAPHSESQAEPVRRARDRDKEAFYKLVLQCERADSAVWVLVAFASLSFVNSQYLQRNRRSKLLESGYAEYRMESLAVDDGRVVFLQVDR